MNLLNKLNELSKGVIMDLKEQVINKITKLSEEQVSKLLIFIDGMNAQQRIIAKEHILLNNHEKENNS